MKSARSRSTPAPFYFYSARTPQGVLPETHFGKLFASKIPSQEGPRRRGQSLITAECSERNRPFSWPQLSIGTCGFDNQKRSKSKLNHLLSKILPLSPLGLKAGPEI